MSNYHCCDDKRCGGCDDTKNFIFNFDDLITSPIFNTDGYKPGHWLQFPKGTQGLEAYIESRGGKFPSSVFIGLQVELKKHFLKPITQEQINTADAIFKIYGAPFNREGWQYILDKHGGYLPIRIWAPDEGHVIPTNNLLVKVETSDSKCRWLVFWVVSYIETTLLRGVWYPATTGTISFEIKKMIKKFLEETTDDEVIPLCLPSMLNDFGARGVSSLESAGVGGLPHLACFSGSDNITAALYAMKYYNIHDIRKFPARTVPAAEHSSITSWKRHRETEAYRNMLKQFGGKYPFIAIVSDSYDIFHAVRDIWGTELKDEVIQCGSMIVVRPDSGNPVEVVLKILLILDSKFGHTINKKGYRVLNNVRVIQGDGIDKDMIYNILTTIKGYNFSAENVVYGMGGALLQHCDRDWMKWAQKTCSAQDEDGNWYDVYKDPITDSGKRSKRGQLMLYWDQKNGFWTGQDCLEHRATGAKTMLNLVLDTGKLLVDHNWEDVVTRLNSYL